MKLLLAITALMLMTGCSEKATLSPRLILNRVIVIKGYDTGVTRNFIQNRLMEEGVRFEPVGPILEIDTQFYRHINDKEPMEIHPEENIVPLQAGMRLSLRDGPETSIEVRALCSSEKNSRAVSFYYCVFGNYLATKAVHEFLEQFPKQTPHKQ